MLAINNKLKFVYFNLLQVLNLLVQIIVKKVIVYLLIKINIMFVKPYLNI